MNKGLITFEESKGKRTECSVHEDFVHILVITSVPRLSQSSGRNHICFIYSSKSIAAWRLSQDTHRRNRPLLLEPVVSVATKRCI